MDSTLILPLLALAVAVGALYVAARRAVTIAELDIERGIIRVVRGGIAPPILADLRDVAKRPPIDGLQVRILRSSGRAEVQLIGSVTDHQAQQIRNVIGRVPLARLVNAPKSKPRR
ncbi:MAG: hypothetical protein BGO98_16835 [Myxococcales bacterium 68-20]|nr:DUF3634 family protein [Myxococcales bacterium]OJY24568.1 MAG: hypothetical protein BGO98_16835 [Myxococcales bacterium 68-20]